MTTLGPDEISELAECLWDACAASERFGNRVAPGETCPLKALFVTWQAPLPGIGDSLRWSFIHAFDNYKCTDAGHDDPDGVALGRRFREQALSGEGFR